MMRGCKDVEYCYNISYDDDQSIHTLWG
jgi:hypothetical protein